MPARTMALTIRFVSSVELFAGVHIGAGRRAMLVSSADRERVDEPVLRLLLAQATLMPPPGSVIPGCIAAEKTSVELKQRHRSLDCRAEEGLDADSRPPRRTTRCWGFAVPPSH